MRNDDSRPGSGIWSFIDPVLVWVGPEDSCPASKFAGAYRRRLDAELLEQTPIGRGADGTLEALFIEWEPGADCIGDFIWSPSPIGDVVSQRVADALMRRFKGIEIGPVEMVQEPRFYELKRKPRIPRVLLPYTGPPLVHLVPQVRVDMDLERSTYIRRRVPGEEQPEFSLEGAERVVSERDDSNGTYRLVHHARRAGEGVYVPAAALGGNHFFGVRQFELDYFVTDVVRKFVQEQEFTNVAFMECGELF